MLEWKGDGDRSRFRLLSSRLLLIASANAISKMLNLAELWGLRADGSNPCRHVERFCELKRERFLSPVEISRLGAALVHLEREQSITPAVAAAVRVLLLTGAQRGEILQLRWESVDVTHACLRLPDSKTGAKSREAPPRTDLQRSADPARQSNRPRQQGFCVPPS